MNPSAQTASLTAALAQIGPHYHFCSKCESTEEDYALTWRFITFPEKP